MKVKEIQFNERDINIKLNEMNMYMTAGNTHLKIREIQSVPPGSHPRTVLVPNGPHLYPLPPPPPPWHCESTSAQAVQLCEYMCSFSSILCYIWPGCYCRSHKSLAYGCVCSVWALVHRSSEWRSPVCMGARPSVGGATKRSEVKNIIPTP